MIIIGAEGHRGRTVSRVNRIPARLLLTNRLRGAVLLAVWGGVCELSDGYKEAIYAKPQNGRQHEDENNWPQPLLVGGLGLGIGYFYFHKK